MIEECYHLYCQREPCCCYVLPSAVSSFQSCDVLLLHICMKEEMHVYYFLHVCVRVFASLYTPF